LDDSETGFPVAGDVVSSPRRILSMQGLPALLDSGSADALVRRLGLSEEQAKKIDEMRIRFYRETKNIRYEILRRRLDMAKLFSDPDVDRATLHAREEEMSVLWRKLMDVSADLAFTARQILSRHQIERLEQLMER
jgi:hypothetical protein